MNSIRLAMPKEPAKNASPKESFWRQIVQAGIDLLLEKISARNNHYAAMKSFVDWKPFNDL